MGSDSFGDQLVKSAHSAPDTSDAPIKAYIVNAGKQVDGEYIGAWHSFPTTQKAVQETLKAIGVDGRRYTAVTMSGYETEDSSLYYRLPGNAHFDELNYLAVKLAAMSPDDRDLFEAAMQKGVHGDGIKGIINLTENLGCFELQPVFSPQQYGEFLLDVARDESAEAMTRLEQSRNESDSDLASYVSFLEEHVDTERYGRDVAENEGGLFTDKGYLTQHADVQEIYTDMGDIPAEHWVFAFPEPEKPPVAKTAEKPSVLEQLAAARAESKVRDAAAPEKPTPEKPKAHGPEL